MKKKILAAGLGLSLLMGTMGTAFAEENAKANEYRQITAGGAYHITYKNSYGLQAIAVNGKDRVACITYPPKDAGLLGAIPYIGILFSLQAMSSGGLSPTACYLDGKYYQFLGKKEVRVATESEITDPNIDPMENWDSVKTRLAIPMELRMFAQNDNFDGKEVNAPVYVESGVEKGKKGERPYDKYVKQIKNDRGQVLSEDIYYVYYKDDKLDKIRTTMKKQDGQEVKIREITVTEFEAAIPKKMQGLPGECKIYKAGLGDMDDLLDNKVFIGTTPKEAQSE